METALVPTKPARIRRRDKFGLQLNQKRALIAFTQGATWDSAAKEAGVEVSTIRGWIQNDPAFKTEYDNLLTGLLGEFQGRMTTLLPKGEAVMLDALEANKPIEVESMATCPKCGHAFPHKAQVEIPNHAIRLHALENLQRQHGLLGQTLKVEGDIEHHHTLELSTDDRIALQLIRRGRVDAVPPDVVESLRQRGVIEGEYRELPDSEPTSAESD